MASVAGSEGFFEFVDEGVKFEQLFIGQCFIGERNADAQKVASLVYLR